MSEMSSMVAGVLLNSPTMMRGVAVAVVLLLAARVLFALRGKGETGRKTRVREFGHV
jgi:hypothetical protein